jgi:hypothetical protein
MGSVVSGIRTTEDLAGASLYQRSADEVDFGARAGGTKSQIPRQSGHTYDNSSVGENARAHFGDIYNHTVNYGPSDPRDDPIRQDFFLALSFHRMCFRLDAIDPAYVETSRWVSRRRSSNNGATGHPTPIQISSG